MFVGSRVRVPVAERTCMSIRVGGLGGCAAVCGAGRSSMQRMGDLVAQELVNTAQTSSLADQADAARLEKWQDQLAAHGQVYCTASCQHGMGI